MTSGLHHAVSLTASPIAHAPRWDQQPWYAGVASGIQSAMQGWQKSPRRWPCVKATGPPLVMRIMGLSGAGEGLHVAKKNSHHSAWLKTTDNASTRPRPHLDPDMLVQHPLQ